MNKTICYYHSKDFDGKASGAVIKLKYPEAEMIGWDYADPIPEVEPGNHIIMADICFEEKSGKVDKFEPMLHVAEISKSFIWIDHHATAIDAFNKTTDPRKDDMITHLKIGTAACELCWEYFFGEEPEPIMLKLLGTYDVWKNQDKVYWDMYVMPFQYGLRQNHMDVLSVRDLLKSQITNFKNEEGYNPEISSIMSIGHIILEYQKKQNTNLMRFNGYEVEFEGLRAIVINSNLFSSTVFDGFYDESKHDIMINWLYNGKKYKYSLYTTKPEIHVGEIAVKYMGGGHKGAAGFENKNYIL